MGFVDVVLRGVTGNRNNGQGLQVTENGGGDIGVTLVGSEFTGNGNTAVEMEEEDEGDVVAEIMGWILVGEPGEESLDVVEGDAGSGVLRVPGGLLSPAPVSSEDVLHGIRP